MAQQHKGTSLNRYPRQFRAVRHRIRDKHANAQGRGLRILSFGCSSGEEMKTIRRYFPKAEILGCDVDLSLSNGLTDLPGPVFFSNAEEIAAHGPYDVIFANSVLCLHPLPLEKSIAESFPFEEFEGLFGLLDSSLRSDGIICAYNPSYRFRDMKIFSKYRPLRMHGMGGNGFLPVYDRSGRMLADRKKKSIQVRDRNALTSGDLMDCVFERCPGPPLYVGPYALARNALALIGFDRLMSLETVGLPAKGQK